MALPADRRCSGCPAHGPGATNHFEGGGFVRSNDDVAYPNLMFHFLPVAVRYDGQKADGEHGYQVHIGPMYSDARGTLKIRSTDPRVHPSMLFNYLSTDQDRREWVEAIHVARDILGQSAMRAFNGGELSPGRACGPTSEILDWVARDAETALHPSCTAKMGTGRRWPSWIRWTCACTAPAACASWTPRPCPT